MPGRLLQAVVTSVMFLSGCARLGILFLPDTQPLVRAEFELPAGKTAVIVDDLQVSLKDTTVQARIADRVIDLLDAQWSLRKVEFIPCQRSEGLETEMPDGRLVSIQQLGRRLDADTIIYVNLTQFDLQSEPDTPLIFPAGRARIKVVKVSTGERLWPIDLAGRAVRVTGRRQSEALNAKSREKWTDTLVEMLAGQIADLFYDHRESQ